MQPLSFTTIDAFDSIHEANVAVAILAENNIDSVMENETLVANDWLLSGAVGGVKVQVPLDQVPRAREVLSEWRRHRAERIAAGKDRWIVFRCTGCKELIAIGAENANRVENCPRCRRYVDVPAESDPTISAEVKHATIESSQHRKTRSGADRITAPWFLIFECLVVLGFAYVPYQFWATNQWYGLEGGDHLYVGFLSTQDNAALIARSVIVIIFLLMILLIHGDLKPHGITLKNARQDTIIGMGIGIGIFLLGALLTQWFGGPEYVPPPTDVHSAGLEEWITIVGGGLIGLLLNSVAEEFAMRGYFTVRLEQLTGNAFLAVAIPAMLYAGYHVYEGILGAAMAGITGVLLGWWFFKTRRLLGPIVSHSCVNLCYMLWELLPH